jgi:hypothetical protein
VTMRIEVDLFDIETDEFTAYGCTCSKVLRCLVSHTECNGYFRGPLRIHADESTLGREHHFQTVNDRCRTILEINLLSVQQI